MYAEAARYARAVLFAGSGPRLQQRPVLPVAKEPGRQRKIPRRGGGSPERGEHPGIPGGHPSGGAPGNPFRQGDEDLQPAPGGYRL